MNNNSKLEDISIRFNKAALSIAAMSVALRKKLEEYKTGKLSSAEARAVLVDDIAKLAAVVEDLRPDILASDLSSDFKELLLSLPGFCQKMFDASHFNHSNQ